MTTFLRVVTLDDNNIVDSKTAGDFHESPTDPKVIVVDESTFDSVRPGDIHNGDGTFTHVPRQRTQLTVLEFRHQFTMAEKQALYAAAETDPVVKMILDDLAVASYIETTDQDTVDSVNYLASTGIITAARATEILNGVTE
jgi:hypothetical protein